MSPSVTRRVEWRRGRSDRPASRVLRTLHAADASEVSVGRIEAMLPEGILQDDEVVLLLVRPSTLFVLLGSLGGLTTIAVVTLIVAMLTIRFTWIPLVEVQVYAAGVAAAAARLLWQTLDWIGRLYILTDRRVIRRVGVLHVNVFETSLRSIQHTSVFRILRERLFGLGTIGFATAGSDVFDAFWVMVRNPFVVHKTVLEAIERYGRGR